MKQERLGLFDTPPNRVEIRIGLAVVALVTAILLGTLPVYNIRVAAIPGLVPALDAAMLVCDLITAAILYAQAAVFRSRALTVLASGYVFSGLLLVPWALTFPGAFSETGLLGAKVNTTGWIAVGWRFSVPIAIIFYARLKRTEARQPVAERPAAEVIPALSLAVALAIFVTMLTTLGHDLLPSFFIDQNTVVRSTLITVNLLVIACTITAVISLSGQERSVLDLWLLVALAAWLAQSLLNLLLQSRFSLGADIFLGLVLVSNLCVMLALITESNRLYARLALSTATRNREHDIRLMSMDAVAAAIAHEVGQPLTAANINVSAALASLTAAEPDVERAIGALGDARESGRRTFDVIASIRATFTGGPGPLSEFSLNDLVRETAALMDRELAAEKVSLQLSLDDGLPTIQGYRVQIQRVIVNLLTNAIEAMADTRGSGRSIAIRSMPVNGQEVQLDIKDSGAGISAEKAAKIFEPFFTTKASGTGLGLALSRTIVEGHGGRLWASPCDGGGTTFHVQLKRHPASI